MTQTVKWMSAFVDVRADLLEKAVAFWSAVSDSSPTRAVTGRDEFVTLEPRGGDPCLWLQRVGEGEPASHPDLYFDDQEAAARFALDLGAELLFRDESLSLVVVRTPAGLPLCLVRHRGQHRPPPAVGPVGARSTVDQLCLDIPPSRYRAECEFWTRFTGWELHDDGVEDEFKRLRRPAGFPYGVLLQRLDEERPRASAHLDLACDDRAAETARHVALGASVVREHAGWTVMRDPVGTAYCLTDRRPA